MKHITFERAYIREEFNCVIGTDFVEYLCEIGEPLKRSGQGYRLDIQGERHITVRGNRWYGYIEAVGGDAVEFQRRFKNYTFTEAVGELLSDGTQILLCFYHDDAGQQAPP